MEKGQKIGDRRKPVWLVWASGMRTGKERINIIANSGVD
jgi:hypothetical protein